MSKLSQIEHLEQILAITGGNLYWLDLNGVYQGCNNNVVKFFGFTSQKDIIGKTNMELSKSFNKEASKSFDADNAEVIRTKKAKHDIEEPPYIDKDGNTAYFLTTRVPIFDANGNVVGVVGTSMDITTRVLAERALVVAKEQAQAANRAKTEFLANMSHDVKSPMTGVVTFAHLMMSNPKWLTHKTAEQVHSSAEQILKFFDSCFRHSRDLTQPIPYIC